MELVTVAHTREHQGAHAAMRTHGKKVFVTGGKHVTSDDMFKAVEINRQAEEVMEREKEKKSWVECHARQEAVFSIVDCLKHELENSVA
jgi:hypothetical protein